MVKRNLIILLLALSSIMPLRAQVKKQDQGLKREVTLYNPYKPTLPEATKRSFLPDMRDTTKVRPDFNYNVKTTPFLPEYNISPIKAASLISDPLPKLYKSYIKAGAGNYFSPLAELSITNERSKKGAFGFYARHYSTNGKVEVDNGKKEFAGYMDNDASLFGKKFFRKSVWDASIDYTQKVRYAYGYDPVFTDYVPVKKDIRMPYSNIGGRTSFYSANLDSSAFRYDFDASFDYFYTSEKMYQRKVAVKGEMIKIINGFYAGAGIGFEHFRNPDFLFPYAKYIASVSPFISKKSELWYFKLGIEALLDRNLDKSATLHMYPDFNFAFNIVPSYINFFAGLNGKLERNEPMKIVMENPYLLMDGSLFNIPNTSHDMIVSSGLKGNDGLGGNYILSGSYSVINDMVFYSNIVTFDIIPERGNHFSALFDDVKLFNLHGEISGQFSSKLSFNTSANYYHYDLAQMDFAWNKPDWDALLSLKYNLRDKIIAGVDITAMGKRVNAVNATDLSTEALVGFAEPVHFDLSLGAEYRYSKILSFWTKLNNISNDRYHQWKYYPTQRFMFMLGFTYSL